MRLSVIVPFYNAAPTLRATIVSILEEVNSDDEIILVDDGSTDNSLEIARTFGSRVSLLSGPNRGVSSARNAGFHASSGEWIVFVDSDDLLKPGTLAERFKEAARCRAEIVICDWVEFTGTTTGGLKDTQARQVDMDQFSCDPEVACIETFWAPPVACMYSRNVVIGAGGFKAEYPIVQDAHFLFDAVRTGAVLCRSEHVGAAYRVLPDSLSRRHPDRFWVDCMRRAQSCMTLWTNEQALTARRRAAISGVVCKAAYTLFLHGHPGFLEGVSWLRKEQLGITTRLKIAAWVSERVGVRAASQIFASLHQAKGRLAVGATS
jgi:glycosyltransferase involved in cell wall biosynthesis